MERKRDMQISERLKAVAALVTSGGTVADIGTDHAYIPIYLIQTGKAERAVAMDINRGPLTRAREHIAQYGLEALIGTRLSDGLAELRPGEADSVVIAGMGGPLTVRILENGRDRLEGCRELILQPQSEIRLVRGWLGHNGWRIAQEDMIREDGKFYPMMRAERGGRACFHMSERRQGEYKNGTAEAGTNAAERHAVRPENGQDSMTETKGTQVSLTDMELRFGPLLLRERHPVLREFLLRESELNRRILASLEGQTGEAAAARAEEVRGELRLIGAALAEYEENTVRVSVTMATRTPGRDCPARG